MKTVSKIFGLFFLSMGIFAAGAVVGGKIHQLLFMILGFVFASILLADAGKKIESNEKINL